MSQSMLEMFDADFTEILHDETGPAEDVMLLPSGSEPRDDSEPENETPRELPLRGVFDLATQEAAPGSRVPVISRRPVLALRHADIYRLIGRGLTKRDRFVVRGRTYRVETPEPDGIGGVAVKLLEAE